MKWSNWGIAEWRPPAQRSLRLITHNKKEKKQPLRRNSTTNQSSWRMVCWSFPLACRGASAPWGPACSCSLSLIHEFNSIKFTSSKTSWRCCAPFLFFNHISLFLFSINYFIPFIIDGREKEERSFLCFPSLRSLSLAEPLAGQPAHNPPKEPQRKAKQFHQSPQEQQQIKIKIIFILIWLDCSLGAAALSFQSTHNFSSHSQREEKWSWWNEVGRPT